MWPFVRCQRRQMMLEQLPVFTNVETEAPGDLAKNTKLVIGSGSPSAIVSLSKNPGLLESFCLLRVLRVTLLKRCIMLTSSHLKG